MTQATTFILELNDHQLCLNSADGYQCQPGYAIFDDKGVMTGEPAKAQYRLRPLNASNQFWDQVSVDPIRSNTPHVTHNADLVYQQLKSLLSSVQCETLIIAAPGSFSDRQLALILGICQSLSVRVASVVDSALLQSVNFPDGSYFHLDFLLHQAVITHIDIQQRTALKQKTLLVPGCGMAQWEDIWARAIADEFIRQTRYNPLHNADNEQELYLQLNAWMQGLESGESEIDLAGQSIKLSLNYLLEASQSLFKTLDQHLASIVDSSGTLVLSPVASEITKMSGNYDQALALANEQIRPAACQYFDQLSNDHGETALIESLKLPNASGKNTDNTTGTTAEKAYSASSAQPTHILINATAYPLNNELTLSSEFNVNQASSLVTFAITASGIVATSANDSVLVNNAPLQPETALNIGDTIRYQDHQATMIQVL
ncbi:hypothetical protein [Sessilibacter corallicola]|uniref:FHA domain-containing protein n=1 Tax=Sessilibacter corallicola TaxID=2904075 RepID=A0ABQ0A6K2_9GAMM